MFLRPGSSRRRPEARVLDRPPELRQRRTQRLQCGCRQRSGQAGPEHRVERPGRRVEEGPARVREGQDGRAPVRRVRDAPHPADGLEAVDALADGSGRDRELGRQVLDAASVEAPDQLEELELPRRDPVLGAEPVVERVVEPRLEPHEVGEHPGEVGHDASTSWFLPEKVRRQDET